jgi:hypothetical protein
VTLYGGSGSNRERETEAGLEKLHSVRPDQVNKMCVQHRTLLH